jgi:hypothetical protein
MREHCGEDLALEGSKLKVESAIRQSQDHRVFNATQESCSQSAMA